MKQNWKVYIFAIIVLMLGCTSETKTDDLKQWATTVSGIVWIAYSPTQADPTKGIDPTIESISEDLAVLSKAGFTGLVTYSSKGVIGRELPMIARSKGFKGIIMGVWDPLDKEEAANVIKTANEPIILGFCIGNEGLRNRYQPTDLSQAMKEIRKMTKKPVTTTEEIDDYADTTLLQLGDWVFPNAHPFFHNKLNPESAVKWTEEAFQDLKRRSNRFVMFKEVGLPTEGDSENMLSESVQEQYYSLLVKTKVRFVYFEAFDQPWKTHLPVEPHWGIFYSDRTPKRLGWKLMGEEPPSQAIPERVFYIYQDASSPDNHYKPTGYMGDCGDIHINEAFTVNPHSGQTCIKITYDAKGKGPNECPYNPPCKWAGVYWQQPPNNWGKNPMWKGKGIDLSEYKRLVFWARSDNSCTIEFKFAGIDEPYGDSQTYPRSTYASLNENWQEFTIDLKGCNLKHIIGGFCWASNWDTNSTGVTFYLDDVRFENN